MAARELKPGMKGTATITTQTTVTPVSVTEVKNGTVMQASGASIIVRTDQGIKMFSQGELDKRGVKIVKDGQPAEISDFHEGDKLTAVIVTSKPPRVMTQQQVNATLAKAAPAGASAAGTSAAQASLRAPHRTSLLARLPQAQAEHPQEDQDQDPRRREPPGRSCRRPPARGRCSSSRASCRSEPESL